MMPVVRLNDATFLGLREISKWMETNTPSETIELIVKKTMESLGLERDDDANEYIGNNDGNISRNNTSYLTFSKIKSVSINGIDFNINKWSELLYNIISFLQKDKGLSKNDIISFLKIPTKIGNYNGRGFRYNEDLGISIQGQSAPDAWKEVERIANKWDIPVFVEFQWPHDDRAAYPGKSGTLRAGIR